MKFKNDKDRRLVTQSTNQSPHLSKIYPNDYSYQSSVDIILGVFCGALMLYDIYKNYRSNR